MSRFGIRPWDHRHKRNTILCLLLLLATLTFYNPIIHNGFTNFDDNGYITDNVHVRSGLAWSTVKWAFASLDLGNWHPLTWLSHALDYQIFKLNPVGSHYVNVLLHAANAVLLFLLLEAATGMAWPSLIVGALFALHPINVESVAWASERKNVLSMFFFLLTMRAYGFYARKASWQRFLLVAVLFALGLMAKPEIVTLPFVLLLWDYWPLERMGRRASDRCARGEMQPRPFSWLVLEKVPLFMLCAGSAVITLLAQEGSHAVRGASARVRFGNALVAYTRYLGKAFWPDRLAAMYPHPGRLLPNWQIAASAALLVILTALVLYRRDRRYLAVGWFWFLGTLVPVIGLVQVGVQAMADRYAYLSFIGLFICVVWGGAEIAKNRKALGPWLAVLTAAILVTLGMVTRHQIGYWRNSETLWRHALSVTEMNYSAHDALARALAEQGRVDEAIAEYKAAGELHAYPSSELVSIGLYELGHDHVQDAIEELRQAVNAAENNTLRANALSCLGFAFLHAHDISDAKLSYAAALQQNAQDPLALLGAGLLDGRSGNRASALTRISQSMQIRPTDMGYLILAEMLRRAGRPAEANDAEAQAARLSHDIVLARQSASKILEISGNGTNEVSEAPVR